MKFMRIAVGVGLYALTLAGAKEQIVDLPTAKELNQELVKDKTSEGPMGRGSLSVFRNDQGLIGGYVSHDAILDSPIHYYDANGKYLGTFHIFGDSTENRKTEVVVTEMKKHFPHEDDATWLTPIPKVGEPNALLGKWEYTGCAIKNTKVEGTLHFYDPRTLVFDGKIHKDIPTTSFRSDYKYYLVGTQLHFQKPDKQEFMPPVSPYFLCQGDRLYFASQPLKKIMDPDDLDHKANWTYRLKRQ